jgi:hypothetical protein
MIQHFLGHGCRNHEQTDLCLLSIGPPYWSPELGPIWGEHAVIPAILACVAKRYDRAIQNDDKAPTVSLFAASMVIYMVGCLACELVPFLSTTRVPALLLIAPSMLLSVVGVASISGKIEALWNLDPAQQQDEGQDSGKDAGRDVF